MSWKLAAVDAVLTSHGFAKGQSDQYSRQSSGQFKMTAWVWLEGGFGEPKTDNVRRVDMSLDNKGTVYRCHSQAGLTTNISKIITKLDILSQTPDLLKCPECGTRYVHMKESLGGGKKFKPFLSCDGMTIVGKGRDKRAACRGVSTKIPALVEYK